MRCVRPVGGDPWREVQMAGYADLIEADRRTLHFTPYGLAAGVLRPDDAVAFQSEVIADVVLTGAVPDDIRAAFERLRDKHVRGVVDYGNFGEVCNQAVGLYEPALRRRFVEFYRGRDIPFVDRDGTAAPLRGREATTRGFATTTVSSSWLADLWCSQPCTTT
jgi:hypothetical protein